MEAQDYSENNATMLANALLKSGDKSLIPPVLKLLEKRPHMQSSVIQLLSRYQISTKESLKVFHEGLQDSSSEVRRISVDAVGNLANDVRKGFEPDLLHLVEDPKENPQVKQRAEQVLSQR